MINDAFVMQDTTSISTSLPLNLHLTTSMPYLLTNSTSYRQLIGKLNFIVHTRLDLSYAIQRLGRFNRQPSQAHFDATLHVLRYLKGIIS